MEVMEVRVAAVSLPAVLAAILVASEHGDGVQCVGLTMIIANPCSTPQAGKISISYPAGPNIQKGEWRMGDGLIDGEESRLKKMCCRYKSGCGRANKRLKKKAEGVEM